MKSTVQTQLASALMGLALLTSSAALADQTGAQVVQQVCAGCHTEGQHGAPRIGVLADWIERTPQGLARLTERAISGIGKMPAHGGQSRLTDLEISRAVAFMVSTGRAKDPDKPYASPAHLTGEQLVQGYCSQCHGTGLQGAPRINVFDDWRPRLARGVDGLVSSAISGHKAMPARADMPKLSDTDLRNAVVYMVVQSATYRMK
jgi:cytochrome c5